eukprot:TRINITY_DN6290_c1_g1_i2.p3 TRINITY_DN6290_c1_g1~~TRINITY_DN6290_c1_g1_i2.p3  ORF type:complete len:143 (-),score=42.28 TRINITY_DN6290_c1_g1_i2:216-644(-)
MGLGADAAELDRAYELPDGGAFVVGTERFRCTEPLFQPSLVGLEGGGVHECAYDAVMRCDVDVRRELYGNVVVVGGSAGIEGLGERLRRELMMLPPSPPAVRVVVGPEGRNSCWVGGSLVGSEESFEGRCVSKEEFMEYGPI